MRIQVLIRPVLTHPTFNLAPHLEGIRACQIPWGRLGRGPNLGRGQMSNGCPIFPVANLLTIALLCVPCTVSCLPACRCFPPKRGVQL